MPMTTAPTDTPASPHASERVLKKRRTIRHVRRSIALILLAMLGSAIAITSFGAQTYHWRAFDIEVRLLPSLHGRTEISFIPLGSVHAATHRVPVNLRISLIDIDFDKAKLLISRPPPPKALDREFRQVAKNDLNSFAGRQVIVGCIGGLLAPILLRPRRVRVWLTSSLIGGGTVGVLLLLVISTFNPAAFESPTYTGALQQAEWVITLVKDGFNKVEALSVKLRNVATNLSRLYERINLVPSAAADANSITVLHISDIHNNPASVAFVQQLVQGTHVDLVVNTGDLTDFGLPLETEITRGLAGIKAPYVFVAGNHDSPAIISAARTAPNTTVLDGKVVDVAGIRLLGTPDPSAVRGGANNVNSTPQELSAASAHLANLLTSASPTDTPDIICVHDPLQAQGVIGKAPVVLCGHEHRNYIDVKSGTVICNAGTTGAAGARYFDLPNGIPMSAAILCFSKTPKPRLLYIDQVVLQGSLREYSISRQTFGNTKAPSPITSPTLPSGISPGRP